MRDMHLRFLGGATTVTGSQFLLTTEQATVLVDCGMFQGSPNESIRNRVPFAFEPASLDAVVLTHAHLDHCGLLPVLVREGYRGPIHATAGTVELATLVLLDSGHLHEEFAKREARWEKRHPDEVAADDAKEAAQYQAALDLAAAGGSEEAAVETEGAAAVPTVTDPTGQHVPTTIEPATTAGGPVWPRDPEADLRHQPPAIDIDLDQPLYTVKDAERTLEHFRAIGYGEEREIAPGRARHVPRCRPHPRLGDHPAAGPGPARRRGADHRLQRRPRPPGHADPARPDPADGRGLRPRRVDVRWPRTRAAGRGHPDPGRDDPPGRCRQGRAPRAVVRHRTDPGGRLGARPADRARRDPVAAALPRLADGLEGLRHLSAPPRLLRRGDRRAAALRARPRSTTRTRS